MTSTMSQPAPRSHIIPDILCGSSSEDKFLASSLSKKGPQSPWRTDLSLEKDDSMLDDPMFSIRRTVTMDSDDGGDSDELEVPKADTRDTECDQDSSLKNQESSTTMESSLDETLEDDDTTVDTNSKSTSFMPMNCESQEETVAATTIHDCIQKMRRKRRKLKYQVRGCSAISTILNSLIQYAMNNGIDLEDMGPRVLYDDNLVAMVAKAMRRFPGSAELQEEACSTLYYLSLFDRACAVAVSAEIECVVSAMARHQHTGVQEEGCSIISTLSGDTEYHDHITSNGGIHAVLCAMKQHPWNARILETCFAALCNLASNTDLQQRVGEEGVDVILASVSMHPTDCSIQEYGCAALANLSMNCQPNQIRIGKDNGVAMIVDAMKHDPQHSGIQESACAALANLASSADMDIINKIRSAGGADAILVSIKTNLRTESIHEHGCRAFSYLTQKLEKRDPSIDNYDAIRVILTGMRFYVENPQIQGHGCAIIRNVCRNSNSREIIASVGGIGTVIVGMRQHCDDAFVQENACAALFNLAQNDPDNVCSISSEGGMTAVAEAMKQHPSSLKVQLWGCRTLSYLFFSNSDYGSLVAAGVLEALVLAVNNHRSCQEISYLALPALKELSSKGKFHNAFAEAGGITTILSVMRCNGYHVAIQNHSCSILQNVSLNVTAEKLIARHGGIGTILAAMRINADNVFIQISGLGCLCNMSSNQDSQCDLLSEGGLDTILAAMVEHNSAELQAKGCLLLYSLTDSRDMIPFLLERDAISVVQAAKGKMSNRSALQNASTLLRRLKRG